MAKDNSSLPVVTFEEFMLAGDTPAFPMSFVFEFELDGHVDETILNHAIKRCVSRHPLLFSILDQSKKRWQFRPDLAPSVGFDDYDSALRFDLKTEVGLRVVVSTTDQGRQRIGFVFHHACSDGLGALGFIRDFAQSCSGNSATSDDSFSQSASSSIDYLRRSRNSYGGKRLLHLLRWPIDLLGMSWSLEMILHRPASISPVPTPNPREFLGGDVDTMESSCGHSSNTSNIDAVLTPDESARARQLSKSASQTLNDRVMFAWFMAIEDWFTKYNPEKSGSLIRLMVPMNLRNQASRSAANMVAIVNFDRKVGRWNSVRRFQEILKIEMQVVKRLRAGVIANRYLQLQKLILGSWPMQTDRNRCVASCFVSNFGDISRLLAERPGHSFQFGNVLAVKFRAITPLRPNTNVFVSLFSFKKRLNFGLTYNANVLNETQARFLLDGALRHLLTDEFELHSIAQKQ